ncbi:anthrax toxin lethal factor-related metalloendopeptidase [Psychrobacillus antarcticus]|uniref:anthrax toxin lethal factor-related metalloendopeptidase n=1 Tax=Psychrobacillus antarcticus TaxID=2879115 RepID=UPI00387EB3F4
MRGVTPRGWESGTWDDVPGLGGNPTIARIGYSDFNNGHGSKNLELHEIAHAIDIYVFDGISNSDEFKKILEKEMLSLMSSHPYPNFIYHLYPEEYFAEAFAYYYLNNERKDELKQRAPLTYSFFQKLEN